MTAHKRQPIDLASLGDDVILTMPDIAEIHNVKATTIRAWHRLGLMPAPSFSSPHGQVFWKTADIREWTKPRRRHGPPKVVKEKKEKPPKPPKVKVEKAKVVKAKVEKAKVVKAKVEKAKVVKAKVEKVKVEKVKPEPKPPKVMVVKPKPEPKPSKPLKLVKPSKPKKPQPQPPKPVRIAAPQPWATIPFKFVDGVQVVEVPSLTAHAGVTYRSAWQMIDAEIIPAPRTTGLHRLPSYPVDVASQVYAKLIKE